LFLPAKGEAIPHIKGLSPKAVKAARDLSVPRIKGVALQLPESTASITMKKKQPA
jgi:hypothetical protein